MAESLNITETINNTSSSKDEIKDDLIKKLNELGKAHIDENNRLIFTPKGQIFHSNTSLEITEKQNGLLLNITDRFILLNDIITYLS